MLSPKSTWWLKVALPASDISRVSATISEPPSLPLNTKSLSETGDNMTGPVVPLFSLKNSVPASLYLKSAPSASSIISPATSTVKSPLATVKALPPKSILSTTKLVILVRFLDELITSVPPIDIPALKLAAPALDISRVSAVINEEPSCPLNNKSPSVTLDCISTLLPVKSMSPFRVPLSLKSTCPPSASSVIPAAESIVKLPVATLISPFAPLWNICISLSAPNCNWPLSVFISIFPSVSILFFTKRKLLLSFPIATLPLWYLCKCRYEASELVCAISPLIDNDTPLLVPDVACAFIVPVLVIAPLPIVPMFTRFLLLSITVVVLIRKSPDLMSVCELPGVAWGITTNISSSLLFLIWKLLSARASKISELAVYLILKALPPALVIFVPSSEPDAFLKITSLLLFKIISSPEIIAPVVVTVPVAPIVMRSVPAVSNLIISSSELSSTCILVSPSASVIALDEPPDCAAKLKLPEPSVFRTWFAVPSEVGNVYAPLNLITPELLISNLLPVSTFVVPITKLSVAASLPIVNLTVPFSANLISASLSVGAFINCLTSPLVEFKCNKSTGFVVPIPTNPLLFILNLIGLPEAVLSWI